MAVTLNKANLVLKDANGNIGKIEQLSNRDLAKIKTAVSDVALVVNQSNHTPIEATTTNKGVVQFATSADVVSGASDKVVTAEQLHNATPATATANTLGVVKPDGRTITINSNGVLTATAQMPGVATTTNVGVVKPDGSTITVDSNGTLTCGVKTIVPDYTAGISISNGFVCPDNGVVNCLLDTNTNGLWVKINNIPMALLDVYNSSHVEIVTQFIVRKGDVLDYAAFTGGTTKGTFYPFK